MPQLPLIQYHKLATKNCVWQVFKLLCEKTKYALENFDLDDRQWFLQKNLDNMVHEARDQTQNLPQSTRLQSVKNFA